MITSDVCLSLQNYHYSCTWKLLCWYTRKWMGKQLTKGTVL